MTETRINKHRDWGEATLMALAHRTGGILWTQDKRAAIKARSLGIMVWGTPEVLIAVGRSGFQACEDSVEMFEWLAKPVTSGPSLPAKMSDQYAAGVPRTVGQLLPRASSILMLSPWKRFRPRPSQPRRLCPARLRTLGWSVSSMRCDQNGSLASTQRWRCGRFVSNRDDVRHTAGGVSPAAIFESITGSIEVEGRAAAAFRAAYPEAAASSDESFRKKSTARDQNVPLLYPLSGRSQSTGIAIRYPPLLGA
jgi:hypothetical protein